MGSEMCIRDRYECQHVIIDNGASVVAADDIPSNIDYTREYLVSTFEVKAGSEFSVEAGVEFHAIPSEPGPYTIIGAYSDPDPDCVDPYFCACCREVFFIDNINCLYLFDGDIVLQGTYTISGNIITLDLQNTFGLEVKPVYRIINSNTITELGTDDILTK